MSNESKQSAAKQAVKDQILSNLRQLDRRIDTYKEKMDINYVNFFEWQADEMYKAQRCRDFYTALSKALDETDIDTDLTSWLLAIAYRKVNDIARGSLTRNSTNQMANVAHLLKLEAEQEIIRDLESLAHIAGYHSK